MFRCNAIRTLAATATLTVSTLTLTTSAALADATVIDADTTLDAHHAGAIVISAPGVTLDCADFMVQGDDTEAVGIDVQADDVTVANCVVDRFTGTGIRAEGVERFTLRRAGASRSPTGVKVVGGAGHLLDWVYVTTATTGVLIDEVRDTTALALYADGVERTGIEFKRAVDSELVNATVLYAGYRGIVMAHGFRSVIRDSVVHQSGDRGIFVAATASSRVEGCTSSHNGHHGIGLYRSTKAVAVGNTTNGNGVDGLSVSQSTAARLDDNESQGNARAGFNIWMSAVITGAGNVAEDNADAPLLLEGEAQADLGPLDE